MFDEACSRRDLTDFETVIETVLVTLRNIARRSSLANLANDHLHSRATTVGCLLEESTLDVHVKTSPTGPRHIAVEDVRKFDDLSGLAELDRLQD